MRSLRLLQAVPRGLWLHWGGRAASPCNGQPLSPRLWCSDIRSFVPAPQMQRGEVICWRMCRKPASELAVKGGLLATHPQSLLCNTEADTNPTWRLDFCSSEGSKSKTDPVLEAPAETVPLVPERMVPAAPHLGVSPPGVWLWRGSISGGLQHLNDAFWGSPLATSCSAGWCKEHRKGLRVSW